MDPGPSGAWRGTLWIALLAAGLALASHLLLGNLELNLADEGFLLYGVQRTLAGEVPLRDFQSYEPGRYYWSAAWCAVAGQGFVALRGSIAAFQALGLFCGLLALRRVVSRGWLLVPLGLVLAAWMFPRHKIYDSSLALMAVYAAVRLVESPRASTYFAAGAFSGLAACFGRNHGLYVALGTGCLALLLACKRSGAEGPGESRRSAIVRRMPVWAGGVVAGFSPVLLMMVFVPGFAAGLLDSIRFFLEQGTNLPKPYPWPWRLGFAHLSAPERVSLALAFLLPVVVYPVGILTGILGAAERLPRRAVLVGASFVGACYAHQASVRSDVLHLAQSIHPALLAAAALPAAFLAVRGRAAALAPLFVTAALVVVTALATIGTHPLLKHYRPGRDAPPAVRHRVLGEELRLDPRFAAYLAEVEATFARHVPPDEREVFMAPTFSSFYPLLQKVSPTWRIYFLWVGTDESQAAIIERLRERDVRWAFVVETAIDGRRELLFRNSHPRVWRWLTERFEQVPTPRLPDNHFLLRRRDG